MRERQADAQQEGQTQCKGGERLRQCEEGGERGRYTVRVRKTVGGRECERQMYRQTERQCERERWREIGRCTARETETMQGGAGETEREVQERQTQGLRGRW